MKTGGSSWKNRMTERHPLFFYTLNTVRRNKNTSLSIMLAILLSSTLLCTMCIYGYTELRWRVEIEEYADGQWHGELGGGMTPDELAIVENNLNVDKTMVKGPFSCLKLSEKSRLPYLLLRDADENYWKFMGEKNLIMEGRLPQKPGEIAVSKSFFEQNPEYRLGDEVTFPEGERRVLEKSPDFGGQEKEKVLDAGAVRREEEVFYKTGERTARLVGKMDITTTTTVPGYYAMGYLDRSALTGDEELTVYVKCKNIRETYEVMPRLADALGIEKDEYGDYENHFRYHTRLLALNFIFPPEMEFSPENWGTILIYGLLLALAAGAFVMIIKGAFQVSVLSRIKQLGMFRSVGATPGQITACVLAEGMLLALFPILLSMGIGYWFTVAVTEIYSEMGKELLYFPITVRFPPGIALLAAGVSLLTVFLSALLPALEVARRAPLEAIKIRETASYGKRRQKKKGRRYPILRGLFGYPGELAGASHYANRRGFRAGVLSLTFCLMLFTGFFVVMRLNDYLGERNRRGVYYNIYGRLAFATEADRELLAEIFSVPGAEESTCFCMTRMAYFASREAETEEFKSRGGFESLALPEWGIVKRGGRYRLRAYLYGLEEESFDAYCRELGEEPAGYYGTDKIKALVWSAAPVYPDVVNNAVKSDLSYSHLKLSEGEELLLEEKTEDDMSTDYVLPVTVGAVADEGPRIDNVWNNYNLNLYVPLSVYYSVAENLSGEKASNYYTSIRIKTRPEEDIAVTEKITELCEAVMAKEDVYIVSVETEKVNAAAGMRAMEAVIDCIGILLVMIGISNTLSAVSHVMMSRRREFAMLRSVGMDDGGIGKLLCVEALRMAVTPVATGIPAVFALLFLLMKLVDVSWSEMLPWMPWGKLFFGIAAVMAAVAVSYFLSAKRIRKDRIIDAVREENV